MERFIKISVVLIVTFLVILIGYEVYQTHTINQLSTTPSENQKILLENQRILLERNTLFEKIAKLEERSLDILENRTDIINSIVENSLINRSLLTNLVKDIKSIEQRLDDIVKPTIQVTPK